MKDDTGGLFEELEPPDGGVERFRQRLDMANAPSGFPLRPVLAFGVAVAALVIAAVVTLQQAEVVEPQIEAVAEPEPKPIVEPQLEPEPESERQTETQEVAQTESQVVAEADPQAVAELDPQLAVAEPEPRLVTRPEPQEVSEVESTLVVAPELVEFRDAPAFDRLLGRPIQPMATTVAIDDMPVTLTQVPGTAPGIRIYEVRTN